MSSSEYTPSSASHGFSRDQFPHDRSRMSSAVSFSRQSFGSGEPPMEDAMPVIDTMMAQRADALDADHYANLRRVWMEMVQSQHGSSFYVLKNMSMPDMCDMLRFVRETITEPGHDVFEDLARPGLLADASHGEDVPSPEDVAEWQSMATTFMRLLRARIDVTLRNVASNQEDLLTLNNAISEDFRIGFNGVRSVANLIKSKNSLAVLRMPGAATRDVEGAEFVEAFITQRADPKKNPLDFVMQHLCSIIDERNYRHIEGEVFREVYLNGQRTYAWEPVPKRESIEQLVYRETQADNMEVYRACLKFGDSVRNTAIKQLINDTVLFPELERNPSVFAFSNGAIYDIDTMEVFDTMAGEFPPVDTVACNLVQGAIDCDAVRKAMSDETANLHELFPTPEIDDIFHFQGYTGEAYDTILSMFGRMLHPLLKYDAWEMMMRFQGVAGTGKSIVSLIWRYIISSGDIGWLSSNQQKKFGMEGIVGKRIIICLEMGEHLDFDMQELKNLISGEPMRLSVKNKQAKVIENPNACIQGSSNFDFVGDKKNDLVRRTFPVLFDRPVPESRKKGDKLKNIKKHEVGNFIVKINIIYRRAAEKYGFGSFWENAPQVFHTNRENMVRANNPVAAFIAEGIIEVYDPAKHGDEPFRMEWSDFRAALKDYCLSNGLKPVRTADDSTYKLVFDRHGIVKRGKALIGCRIAMDAPEDIPDLGLDDPLAGIDLNAFT